MIRRLFPDSQNIILPDSNGRVWNPYFGVSGCTRNRVRRARAVIMKFALDLKNLLSCRGFGLSHNQMQEEDKEEESRECNPDGGRSPSPDGTEGHDRPLLREMMQMQSMKLSLNEKLCHIVGERRCQELLRDHVRRWDIMIMATAEDQDFAYDIRDDITDELKGLSLAGPWEIKLGEDSLGRWERMLRSSSVIVILVSKAFLRDSLLKHLCAVIMSMSPKKKVIPVYLEQIRSRDFPRELETLRLYYGIDAHHISPNDIVKPLVRCLPKRMAFERILEEIVTLRTLLLKVSLQPEAYL